MRRLLWIPLCALTLFVPVVVLAGGIGGGFDSVVSSIESRYHVRATRVPFLGVVNFMARRASHGGVANLHVAEFDHFNAAVDGDDLIRTVEGKLGPGWERVIRETSRKGNEQSLIYMRPEGNRMGMFVLDLDGGELDVVQLSVDPGHIEENIAHYSHHGNSGNDSDEGDSD